MRLYVPATLDQLRAWSSSGTVAGHEEPYVADDESEEAEYAALVAAGEDSAALGEGRRVVVVVDVPDETAQLPFDRVVAVHADVPGAELAWFATQEVDDLLRG